MKKKVLWVLVVLGVLVVGFLGVVAVQPGEFKVERSARVGAGAMEVFGRVNDFREWQGWSPWAKKDPNAKVDFFGKEKGVGSLFAWSGNEEVGEGSMEILESVPGERVVLRLSFVKPMEDSCVVTFLMKESGGGTEVTWRMEGENTFVEKAFCLFMDLDGMIGGDFEKGLANMKELVEKEAGTQKVTEGTAVERG